MTRYMRWLEDPSAGSSFDDYDALWRWSTEELEAFWGSIWEFFDVQASYDEVLADASMPGAQWFTGAELSYPEHIFRDRPGDRVAIRHASELRDARGVDVGRAARADRARRRRPAGDGDRARRPRRRLHAEHPRDDRRLPRHREPRRGLVELLAGLRRALGRRPLRPDRAEGAAHRRRLPLRRQGPRPQRADRARPGRDALARAHGDARLPRRRRGRLGRGVPGHRRGARRSSASRSTTRCGSSTPRAPPACRRRSCTRRAGSSSSTSRSTTCTSTRRRATASSGSPPRAG